MDAGTVKHAPISVAMAAPLFRRVLLRATVATTQSTLVRAVVALGIGRGGLR
eukprot:COSAG06_NODE_65502_length_257_cov_0.373418_1_plen_51_part_10